MLLQRVAMGLAVGLLGCGSGGTDPKSTIPATGRYTLSITAPLGFNNQTVSGRLVLTYASSDSIAGYIDSGGTLRAQPFTDGRYNIDAYRIAVKVEPGGWDAFTRLSRGSGDALTCQSVVVWWTTPPAYGSCTMAYIGP